MLIKEKVVFECEDIKIKESIQKKLDKLYKQFPHIRDIRITSHKNKLIIYGKHNEIIEK